ncbi:anti-sigma28 factor (negative regulator of flagellin synthesis) [Granulicella aggregans]|uniref:Anti-sigma28 factor (Negative regulator of flagellin synthesis) n=1 Tax=Granulicella aggregans TaxID=474949 RepID=A0A7W8E2A8_9BACT|nr:anti-sigma28 factor (negative regulator of flagellin synthesis) [Granulicella aggregans]
MLIDRVRPSLHLSAAKPVLASLLLFFQAAPHPEASPQHFRYQRTIRLPSSVTQLTGESCAVLDASVFTHASPSLKDLRIYAGNTEIPYAITLSEPLQQDTDDARILNLGTRSGHIVFDLAMPARPYTAVALDLDAHDFIATAEVSGSQQIAAPSPTSLGSFTLFDLTSQHLSHSTSLPLAESSFPYLHVDLSLAPAPGTSATAVSLNRPEIVKSASVPPSREAQTLYTTLQQTSALVQRGRETVATFQVPARVPIERIAFTLAPGYKGSFSRPVRIEARVTPGQKSDPSLNSSSDPSSEDDSATSAETSTGTILSVHKSEAGREIAQENLTIPTAIGANMQHFAELQVAIENGDDAPLPIATVQLQMRQRRICFDAATVTNSPLQLFYGDSTLEAPVYDYAKLFQPSATPLIATLTPEESNPTFTPRTDARPFTERHPELLWIVLLAVVCILALTAFRSAKKLPR